MDDPDDWLAQLEDWRKSLRVWLLVGIVTQLVAIGVSIWRGYWWLSFGNVYVAGLLAWTRVKLPRSRETVTSGDESNRA